MSTTPAIGQTIWFVCHNGETRPARGVVVAGPDKENRYQVAYQHTSDRYLVELLAADQLSGSPSEFIEAARQDLRKKHAAETVALDAWVTELMGTP